MTRDHKACVEMFTALHAARRELLVPATVVAEVGYLLAREAGARVESLFLRSLADGGFTPVDLSSGDYARMADLVTAYESLPLGTTDASVVAIAERLGLTDVATLDRRHFTVVRPKHADALTLLP
jgi:predicted nucleic acid-binding protein